jgi:hypothetical protein
MRGRHTLQYRFAAFALLARLRSPLSHAGPDGGVNGGTVPLRGIDGVRLAS